MLLCSTVQYPWSGPVVPWYSTVPVYVTIRIIPYQMTSHGVSYTRPAAPPWEHTAREISAALAPDGSDALLPMLRTLGLRAADGVVAVLGEVLGATTVKDLWTAIDKSIDAEEEEEDYEAAARRVLVAAGLTDSESRKIARALFADRARQKMRDKVAREEGCAMPTGTAGGLFAPAFVGAVSELYDLHMGVENMAPLLYSLVRFVKPSRILEIGAGYTSIFLLQALLDNFKEMQNYVALQRRGLCTVDEGTRSTPWCRDLLQHPRLCQRGVLYCVDNMAHAHTTAHRVEHAAETLGAKQHLCMINEDAWTLDLRPDGTTAACQNVRNKRCAAAAAAAKNDNDDDADDGDNGEDDEEFLDMLWIDFGAGKRLDDFFNKWWPKLRKGGLALVHSTVTNEFTRKWLEGMRTREGQRPGTIAEEEDEGEEEYDLPSDLILGPEDSSDDNDEFSSGTHKLSSAAKSLSSNPPSMEFETLSFFEPHKMFQNSFSVFQKRGENSEPVLTKYP